MSVDRELPQRVASGDEIDGGQRDACPTTAIPNSTQTQRDLQAQSSGSGHIESLPSITRVSLGDATSSLVSHDEEASLLQVTDRGRPATTNKPRVVLEEGLPKGQVQSVDTMTSPTAPSLLDLPNEIISQILLSLPVVDTLRSQAVCLALNSVIKSSVGIQYRIALEISGLEDDEACSSFDTSRRFDRLLKGQKAWREFKPRFITPVKVPGHISGGYHDLRGGAYAPGSNQIAGVDCAVLPEKEGDAVEWKHIDVQEQCIDVGLCPGEHDLVAVLTMARLENGSTVEIALRMMQLSTGKPHPEAQQPRIFACKGECAPCGYNVDIVGKNLALRLMFPDQDGTPDRIIVFEWRTGALKASIVERSRSYTGSALLKENVLLLSNARRGTLEIWDLPQTTSEPAPSAPLCILQLPPLAPGKSFLRIRVNGEPNPRRTNAPMVAASQRPSPRQPKPYRCDADHAILAFDITILPIYHFSFFAHRKSILQLADDLRTKLPSPLPIESHPPSDSIPFPAPVPWERWGPKITRWVETSDMVTRWITRSAGQRTVLIPTGAWRRPSSIIVMDFNPWSIKKCKHALEEKRRKFKEVEEREQETAKQQHPTGVAGPQYDDLSDAESDDDPSERAPPQRPNLNHILPLDPWSLLEETIVDRGRDCFLCAVSSELPCVQYTSEERFPYDGVLMDEERIIGLKTNMLDQIEEFDVLYFG